MAKTKKEADKYDPADLEEFKAALAGQDISQGSAGTTVEVKTERQSPNRTVSVDVEDGDSAAKAGMGRPSGKIQQPKDQPMPPPEMQKLQRRTTKSKPWGWIIGALRL